ncbi:hypothetical protein JYT83_00330 [bacterium AH-315-F18]|nr:hypothetical protein [bacterium AH-315-F18]
MRPSDTVWGPVFDHLTVVLNYLGIRNFVDETFVVISAGWLLGWVINNIWAKRKMLAKLKKLKGEIDATLASTAATRMNLIVSGRPDEDNFSDKTRLFEVGLDHILHVLQTRDVPKIIAYRDELITNQWQDAMQAAGHYFETRSTIYRGSATICRHLVKDEVVPFLEDVAFFVKTVNDPTMLRLIKRAPLQIDPREMNKIIRISRELLPVWDVGSYWSLWRLRRKIQS